MHARWLADIGYQVTLLDPSELHVRQARAEAAKGIPFAVRLRVAQADGDPTAWRQVLDVAQRLEREPGFMGVTSDFLGVGHTTG